MYIKVAIGAGRVEVIVMGKLNKIFKLLVLEKHYEEDAVTWDGATASNVYTVSGSVSDARQCVWKFMDNSNTFEEVNCKITIAIGTVTITTPVDLPVGTYTLIGVG